MTGDEVREAARRVMSMLNDSDMTYGDLLIRAGLSGAEMGRVIGWLMARTWVHATWQGAAGTSPLYYHLTERGKEVLHGER